MAKHLVTFEVDNGALFDMVAAVGDGGATLGCRLVGVLLLPNDVGLRERVGMDYYGIELKSVEPAAVSAGRAALPSAETPDAR